MKSPPVLGETLTGGNAQISKAKLSLSQLQEFSDEMGDQHRRMLQSITDVKSP